jgi:Domain of unknown function (DUF1841)
MFNPSREQARDFFFEVWRKETERLPRTPLEDQAWQIMTRHPEYHSILSNPARYRDKDWTPEQGETNPFLHLSLHLAIEEQLGIDQPTGLRAAYSELIKSGLDKHDADHRVIDALAETIWESQRNGVAPDGAAYLQRVRGDKMQS